MAEGDQQINTLTMPNLIKIAVGLISIIVTVASAVGCFWAFMQAAKDTAHRELVEVHEAIDKAIKERDLAIYHLQVDLAVQQSKVAELHDFTVEVKGSLSDISKAMQGMEVSLARIGEPQSSGRRK